MNSRSPDSLCEIRRRTLRGIVGRHDLFLGLTPGLLIESGWWSDLGMLLLLISRSTWVCFLVLTAGARQGRKLDNQMCVDVCGIPCYVL